MTPEMIRQLPATRALVVRGGCSPAIARLPMAWRDPLYRHARRTRQVIALPPPAGEPGPDLGAPWWPGEIASSDPDDPRRSFGPHHPWARPDDPWDEEAGPA
jgi:hypothetical protein